MHKKFKEKLFKNYMKDLKIPVYILQSWTMINHKKSIMWERAIKASAMRNDLIVVYLIFVIAAVTSLETDGLWQVSLLVVQL